jgi:hypothetical protein
MAATEARRSADYLRAAVERLSPFGRTRPVADIGDFLIE